LLKRKWRLEFSLKFHIVIILFFKYSVYSWGPPSILSTTPLKKALCCHFGIPAGYLICHQSCEHIPGIDGSCLSDGYQDLWAAWRHLANELRLVTLSWPALNLRAASWQSAPFDNSNFLPSSSLQQGLPTYAIAHFERRKCLLMAIDLCLRRDFISGQDFGMEWGCSTCCRLSSY